MPLTSLTRVCSIVLMLVPLAAGLAADSAAGKTAAKVLLEKGWKKPAGKDALVDHEDLEKPSLAGDSSVLAAKWLVLMYQSRWDDALAALDRFLKAEPAEELKIQALRAKAWILTVKKDFQKAMVVADQLSQAIAANPQAMDKATLEAQDEVIVFVGRLAGFVEGPSETGAEDQKMRTKLEARVLERLDDARKDKFKAAKTEVLEEFERLTKKAAEAKEDTKADAEEKKSKKLAELSDEEAKLSQKANEVEEKGKRLADEFRTKMLELDRLEMPVVQQINRLQNELSSLNSDLNYQRSLVRRNTPSGDKRDKTDDNERRRAEDAAARLRGQITTANNNLMIAQARQNEIRQARLILNGNATALGQQLINEKSKITSGKAKNANVKARTERVKAGIGGKALTIEAEASAFRTYDPFPLEKLREELLTKMK